MAAIDPKADRDTQASEYPEWFRNKKRDRLLIVSRWVPISLIGLPVLVLLAIVIYPTIWMFFHAFHNTTLMSLTRDRYQFVWFDNFANVFTNERFLNSVVNLVQYLFFGAVLEVILGTAIALMLFSVVKWNWMRTVLLICMVVPLMLPPAMTGLIWLLMLTPHNGIINEILIITGLTSEKVEWFSTSLSLWSITFADIWQWTSLPLLIVYAGRASLPQSIYEAARVDGASRWKVLSRITLPMLKEVIAIAFIIRFMDAYKYVDKIYVMTSGGPAESSELPVYIAYQRGIRDFQVGEAAGYAIVIFAVAAVLVTLFLKYLKKVLKAQAIA